ncbi:uncharacterized protein LOC122371654 [Amphibalanus amphitrite]|uniref:uncharacterized protein LOC122371654 n=1 Tax=Amphibalanus amphitrite TaxID=1232801 RepID=UPI001C92791B|nr:uncharacterized protein LOC122371654 [Amphibalanus amphitrite]
MLLRPLLLLCAALAVAGAANPRQLDAVRHFLEERHLPAGSAPSPRVVRVFTEPKQPEQPAPQAPTPTPSPWFDCPTTFGLYPDPYDCNKYFQCSYGVAFEEQCQPGLEFNPRSNSCDFPSNINPPCQAIPYPTDEAPAARPEEAAHSAAQRPSVHVQAAPEVHINVPKVPQVHVQKPALQQPHVQAQQPHVELPQVHVEKQEVPQVHVQKSALPRLLH